MEFIFIFLSSCIFTSCLLTGIAVNLLSEEKPFIGYEDDGTLKITYEQNIVKKYLHENIESQSGIFLFPDDDYNIISINSEDIFYKIVSIKIIDFPSFISAGENPFTTEIVLQNGYGDRKTLLNKYNFTCTSEKNNYLNYINFFEKFMASNNITNSWNYLSPIKVFEKGKIYQFDSIYIFKLYQQIQKNKDLQQALNDYFNDKLSWDFTGWDRDKIRMFPIGKYLMDSCGYYYSYFTVNNSSYMIVARKDKDTYSIISYQGELLAIIVDKGKTIKYKETRKYSSFPQGEYEIDYYDFIKDKCVVCKINGSKMENTNRRSIEVPVYETYITDERSPLYWEDEERFQKIWHIQWDNATWVSSYKQYNNVYYGRYWEYYNLADRKGVDHINFLDFFYPMTSMDMLRNWNY